MANIVPWCNGNTKDFGPFVSSSNLDGTTKKFQIMKTIYTKYFPQKWRYISLFGFVITSKNPYAIFVQEDINKQKIRNEQAKELGYIFYYILFFLEFIFNYITCSDFWTSVKMTDFEFEVNTHKDDDLYYLNRKHYNEFRNDK